jgi:ribosomal-protein-serine acetyltransferase
MKLTISDTAHLRPLERADARELHGLIEANRAELTRDDGFQAAVVSEGKIAGAIGYVGFSRQHRSTNLGYWLDAKHQGRGTMTAAVRALVDRAFSVWNLNRVEIRVASENRRSRAIPTRLGFQEEGTLRKAEFVDGRFLDNVVYSMLAWDWSTESR